MTRERENTRRGRHASMAGAPADDVIAHLIRQFSDPYAFIRELIQNALDASASRVDVDMSHANGVLQVAVVDDGEGMDRATVEGYLLVKFRSTKENDLTKIGKFGIGFVSLFAMQPTEVVVDTGRDGVWHRLRFAEDLSYELFEMDEPFEGTTVTLHVRCDARRGGEICRAVHDRASRWCRYLRGDLRTSASGVPDGWPSRTLNEVFGLEGPVVIHDEEGGRTLFVSPSPEAVAGYYNHGLLLLEDRGGGELPGVAFRVDDAKLEHTLTRDNVIRDAAFYRVIERVRSLAQGELCDRVHAATAHAATTQDRAALVTLWGAFADTVTWTWDPSKLWLPRVGGGAISLASLGGGGWLGRIRGDVVLFGPSEDPVGRALAAGGATVVAGAEEDPWIRFLARSGRALRRVSDAYRMALPVDDPTSAARAGRLATWIGRTVRPARLLGAGGGGLAWAADDPFSPRAPSVGAGGGTVVVSVEHPLWVHASRLPAPVGDALLARGIAVCIGGRPDQAAMIAALEQVIA